MHIRRLDKQLNRYDYLFLNKDNSDYEWIDENDDLHKERHPYNFPNELFIKFIVSEINLFSSDDYTYEAYEKIGDVKPCLFFDANNKGGTITEEDRMLVKAFNNLFDKTHKQKEDYYSMRVFVRALSAYIEATRAVSKNVGDFAFHLQNTIAYFDD